MSRQVMSTLEAYKADVTKTAISVSKELTQKRETLATLETLESAAAQPGALGNEAALLLPAKTPKSVAKDTLLQEIENLSKRDRDIRSLLGNLETMMDTLRAQQGQFALSMPEEAVVATESRFGAKEMLHVVANLGKLFGPAALIAAHRNDMASGLGGPSMMMGIIFSAVMGELLPYLPQHIKRLEAQKAFIEAVAEAFKSKIAPILAIATSLLMYGQQTMSPDFNPFVAAALILFSVPAFIHLVAGDVLIKKLGVNPYVITSKTMELAALSLFAFATVGGMQKDPQLKEQLVGVSILAALDPIPTIALRTFDAVSMWCKAKKEDAAASTAENYTALNA